jgi:type IV secretory pathway VirB10-like protein
VQSVDIHFTGVVIFIEIFNTILITAVKNISNNCCTIQKEQQRQREEQEARGSQGGQQHPPQHKRHHPQQEPQPPPNPDVRRVTERDEMVQTQLKMFLGDKWRDSQGNNQVVTDVVKAAFGARKRKRKRSSKRKCKHKHKHKHIAQAQAQAQQF